MSISVIIVLSNRNQAGNVYSKGSESKYSLSQVIQASLFYMRIKGWCLQYCNHLLANYLKGKVPK